MTRLKPHPRWPEHSTPAAPKSQTNILERPGFAAEDFRQWFAPRFAAFLHDHFRSPEHVAVEFGVRHSTAHNWWHGLNRASGDTVALAFLRYPQAVAWYLAEWSEDA